MADSTVNIAGVIQQNFNEVICFDITYRTLAETRTVPATSIVVVLAITSPTGTIHQFINLETLERKYRILDNWDDVLVLYRAYHNDKSWSDTFTYSSVPRDMYYKLDDKIFITKTPFTSNMKDHVSIFGLDHTDQVTGSYLNKKSPYVRNIKSRIRTMPDLVFTKTAKATINFENTLVSVDGNLGYPEYDPTTDELYVKNGAYFLRGTPGPDQNIVFMDFSDMIKSGTSIIKKYFHECSPDLIIGEGDEVTIYHNDIGAVETLLSRDVAWWREVDTTIKFTVQLKDKLADPEVQYVPIVCFGGRLFLPGIDKIDYHQYFKADGGVYYPNVEVSIKVNLDLLSAIVASNLQHAGIFMGNSSFYHASITYALSNIFTSNPANIPMSTDEWRAIAYLCKADIPFVTILPMDKQYAFTKIEPTMSIHDGELIFPYRSRGLLFSKQTKEIIDYNVKDLTSTTMVETEPRQALYLSQRGQAVAHLGKVQGPVTQIQGAADIADFFPVDAEFTYSTLDGNCYTVKTPGGVLLAKSSETTASVPWTSANLVWNIYQTQVEIPDSMRYHDIVSQKVDTLVKDAYNHVQTGVNIHDRTKCYLLEMCYAGKNSPLVEELEELVDETEEPDIPVHTVEYRRIIDPIKKGSNQ